MKKLMLGLWLTMSFIGLGSVGYAMPIISTFDVDAEAWTASGAALSHENTGGNPDGFLKSVDNGSGSYALFAPAKFLGNLSSFDGGLLSYDILQIFPATELTSIGSGFGRIQLLGGGSNATFDYAPDPLIPSPAFWTRYDVPMTASAWNTSTENWNTILSNVTSIEILLDLKSGDDAVGLDNFQISPVPEPATMFLFGVGMVGMAYRKIKTNKRTVT